MVDSLVTRARFSRCELTARAVIVGRYRPIVPVLGGAGALAAAVTVIAGGQVGPVRGSFTLTSWLGLLAPVNARFAGRVVPGIAQAAGIASLVLVWLVTLAVFQRYPPSQATVWKLAACWTAPFVIGPPLLSSDVYSYAAQGALLDAGLNPYEVGPAALGAGGALDAVDPVWRNAPSPYGPITGLVEHIAASTGGSPLGTVIVLRLIATLSVVVIGWSVATLAAHQLKVAALTFTVLNPLILLDVVSAAHLEGVMCALLLLALVVQRRSPDLALAVACAAAAVKAPAAAAVFLIGAQRWRVGAARSKWLDGLRMAGVVGGTCLALGAVVSHSWGWLGALGTPAVGYTKGSPTAILGGLLSSLIPWAPAPDVAAASRIVGLCAAAIVVGYLAITSDRRQLSRSVGLGLLAIAALGPVVYPWYLLWGLVCLAPTAASRADRRLVVATSAFACFMGLTGLTHVGVVTSQVMLIAAAAVTACWWWAGSIRGAAVAKRIRGRRTVPSGVG